ncbi:D-tagatose-bisphosphate aldolase, class II, non-catalytic subunit [Curtobacterium sp. MCSS17_008]|uniref:D-tagatose-bisphosphate aldolase, class II, non-catalytic subunit n=1 Tax=Curtobacterium sp. MCSS17_008 TaxID=2175647 RepID=UPI0015E87C56|nr:D-tagatose-bisphosphate aldolase, class II, non-catalytic subunit [Curtobacterium sp. MCSS17_008]
MNPITALVARHRAGSGEGIYSVCSANPYVLRASMRQALEDGAPLLVEATSNQVDQFGGYTGMTPTDFRAAVLELAAAEGFPADRLVLGGDHLGPNTWQDRPADEAMPLAVDLVRAYVAAGYTKIHLDCSMPLQGEVAPLSDEVVADRAATLLAAAESAADDAGIDRSGIVYVIGTEVPTPGGAKETLHDLEPTPATAAIGTLDVHRAAFERAGLAAAWPRVVALVVQPAVEFDHLQVIDYVPEATTALQEVIEATPGLVYEAHSTDYQTPAALRALVDDHWAILKVGPGLTFGLREALYALDAIESEIVPAGEATGLRAVVERRMLAEPDRWERYYEGDDLEQRIARTYSYSDRMRYYWPDAEITAATEGLLARLDEVGVPLPLLSQYLPIQYERVRDGLLPNRAEDIVLDRVRDVLRPYAAAVAPTRAGSADAVHATTSKESL